MSRLNNPENFRGRVDYAAKVITYGGTPTRAFDNCFENYDGDEVTAAVLRRARKNNRLAANLHRYLDMAVAEAAAERLAGVPTRKLADLARQTRARRKAEFETWLECHHAAKAPPESTPSIISGEETAR